MVVTEREIIVERGTAFGNMVLVLISAPLLRRASTSRDGSLKPVWPLAVQEELEGIMEAFRKATAPVGFQVKVEIATVEVIRRVFTSTNAMIVHFIGHG